MVRREERRGRGEKKEELEGVKSTQESWVKRIGEEEKEKNKEKREGGAGDNSAVERESYRDEVGWEGGMAIYPREEKDRNWHERSVKNSQIKDEGRNTARSEKRGEGKGKGDKWAGWDGRGIKEDKDVSRKVRTSDASSTF